MRDNDTAPPMPTFAELEKEWGYKLREATKEERGMLSGPVGIHEYHGLIVSYHRGKIGADEIHVQ